MKSRALTSKLQNYPQLAVTRNMLVKVTSDFIINVFCYEQRSYCSLYSTVHLSAIMSHVKLCHTELALCLLTLLASWNEQKLVIARIQLAAPELDMPGIGTVIFLRIFLNCEISGFS